jgi:hypothetical protein
MLARQLLSVSSASLQKFAVTSITRRSHASRC